MIRHGAVAMLLAILTLAGCGSRDNDGNSTQAEEAPTVAAPMPATTVDPQTTAALLSFEGRDANHDGILTSAENAAAADKIFRAIDADQDGAMTVDELNAARVALGFVTLPGSTELIAEADQDDDGKLTLAEWIAEEGGEFDAADKNGDGKLNQAEWNAQAHLQTPAPLPSIRPSP